MKTEAWVRMHAHSQRSMCRSFPQERGQNAASDQRLPLDNNWMAKMIRKIVRDEPPD